MKPYTFEIYEANDGYRWRAVSGNGRIVADGGEAYSSAGNARQACERILDQIRTAGAVTINT